MSGTSGSRAVASDPSCEEHKGPPARMTAEVMHVQLSGVSVPVRGWRCPVCGTDHILSADARAAQDYADLMGFGKA